MAEISELERVGKFEPTDLAVFARSPFASGDNASADLEQLRLYLNNPDEAWQLAVDVKSTANVTLATDVEIGDTLNGMVLAADTRFLLAHQTAAAENGAYLPNASGAPTRVADYDNDAEINPGDLFYVRGGTADAQTVWELTSADPHVPDTDDLTFALWSEPAGQSAATVNAQTGTSYTLVLSDANNAVTMDNASANTLTIPTNASVAFPVGTVISVSQIGAGLTTVTGDTGVSVNGVSAGSVELAGQNASVSILKIDTDEWLLGGAVAVGWLSLASYDVAGAPSAATAGAGALIYVTNGNAGSACMAVSDGTDWKVVALGATISAS